MVQEHSSIDYLSARYTFHAREVEGRFIVWIDELELSAEGKNFSEAHDNLEIAKRAHFERCNAVGRIPVAPEEFRKQSKNKMTFIMPFAIKSAITALLIVTTIFSLQIVAMRTMSNLSRNAATVIVKGVDHLGQTSQWVSEERMRDIGRKIGLLYKNTRPMFEEIEAAIQDRDSPSKSGRTLPPSKQ